VFEAAAAVEVVSRSARYEEGQRALAAIEIAKIYSLNGMQPPQQEEPREAQYHAQVVASIRAARFTNGSDEERVVQLYSNYLARVFEAFNEAQHAGVTQVLRTTADASRRTAESRKRDARLEHRAEQLRESDFRKLSSVINSAMLTASWANRHRKGSKTGTRDASRSQQLEVVVSERVSAPQPAGARNTHARRRWRWCPACCGRPRPPPLEHENAPASIAGAAPGPAPAAALPALRYHSSLFRGSALTSVRSWLGVQSCRY
jgi:hypothetical protein